MRLQISVAASHRIGGKISHKHILGLGSVAEVALPLERLDFWRIAKQRLSTAEGLTDEDYHRLVSALEQRIPPLSLNESLELAAQNHQRVNSSELSRSNIADSTQRLLIKTINDGLACHDEAAVCATLLAALEKKNKSAIAQRTGNGRTTIYRAFQSPRHPLLSTLLNILDAIDLHLYCHDEGNPLPIEALKLMNKGFASRDIDSIRDGCADLIHSRASVAFIARQAGMSRTSLYRWLRTGRSPTLRSVIGIVRALRLRLAVETNNSTAESD